jgi:hypothetical protein
LEMISNSEFNSVYGCGEAESTCLAKDDDGRGHEPGG